MLLAKVFFNQRSNTGVLCCAAMECGLLAGLVWPGEGWSWRFPDRLHDINMAEIANSIVIAV
jgi:hypothetical protein